MLATDTVMRTNLFRLLRASILLAWVGLSGATAARPADDDVLGAILRGEGPPATPSAERARRERALPSAAARLERSLERLAHGENDAAELEAAWSAHLEVLAELEAIGDRLSATPAIHPVALERHRAALRRYEEAIAIPLASARETLALGRSIDAQRARLRAELRDTAPPRPIRGALPYHRPALPPRPPIDEPTIVPSYDDAADPPPSPDDLAGTDDAPLSPVILAQAAELAFDPARIYDFVRNEITTEWYGGSMKTAEGTLRQRAGSDTDQAHLLIALLRAAQIHSRYVQGVLRRPIDALAEELGADAYLNELECAEGWIYANVLNAEAVVRISPTDGRVAAIVRADGLLSAEESVGANVLNGIAYDAERETFLLTGKYWPRLFEVRFVPE